MKYPSILLDVGNTLLKRKGGVFSSVKEWLSSKLGNTLTDVKADETAKAILTAPTKKIALNRLKILFELNKSQEFELNQILVRESKDALINKYAIELLDLLKANNWQVIIATNAVAWSHPLPKELLKNVDYYVSSANMGLLKRDAKFWDRIIKDCHIDIEKSLMIGDTFREDIQPAQNAGLATFQVMNFDLYPLLQGFQSLTTPRERGYLVFDYLEKFNGGAYIKLKRLQKLTVRISRLKCNIYTSNKTIKGHISRDHNNNALLFIDNYANNENLLMSGWIDIINKDNNLDLPNEIIEILEGKGISNINLNSSEIRQLCSMYREAKSEEIKKIRLNSIIRYIEQRILP